MIVSFCPRSGVCGRGVRAVLFGFCAGALNHPAAAHATAGDSGEVASRLTELDEPGFHNIFVKHVSFATGLALMRSVAAPYGCPLATQLGWSSHDRECELIAPLPCVPLSFLQSVQLAMDRKDRERELISALLPDLTPGVISPDQVCVCLVRVQGQRRWVGGRTWPFGLSLLA